MPTYPVAIVVTIIATLFTSTKCAWWEHPPADALGACFTNGGCITFGDYVKGPHKGSTTFNCASFQAIQGAVATVCGGGCTKCPCTVNCQPVHPNKCYTDVSIWCGD